ncbi:MAG: hypothetical protein SGI74_10900 [Oligoflexia bacterium]|nr:hypothetical protein [Oligoflexia bacterium]
MAKASGFIMIGIFLFSLFSVAGPINPDPKTNKPDPKAEMTKSEDVLPLQQVDVTTPVESTDSETSFFYPHQSAFSISFGPVFLSPAEGVVMTYGQLSGTYVWQSPTSFHLETGLDATTQGQGHLWQAFRNNFSSSLKWRPFWSLGVGFKMYPERGLITFLSLSNYFFRLALGTEYSIWESVSFRSEMFLAPDMEGRGFFGGILGFSYGF